MHIPCICAFVLMDIKQFQTRTVWIQVGQMNGITMTIAYSIEQLAVIIHSG